MWCAQTHRMISTRHIESFGSTQETFSYRISDHVIPPPKQVPTVQLWILWLMECRHFHWFVLYDSREDIFLNANAWQCVKAILSTTKGVSSGWYGEFYPVDLVERYANPHRYEKFGSVVGRECKPASLLCHWFGTFESPAYQWFGTFESPGCVYARQFSNSQCVGVVKNRLACSECRRCWQCVPVSLSPEVIVLVWSKPFACYVHRLFFSGEQWVPVHCTRRLLPSTP